MSLKPIWVRWYPKDALDGMTVLAPLEELAYRRLLDQIFVTGDNLPDSDRALAWSTKTGRAWPQVKSRLIELGKIEIADGFIKNHRASKICTETASFIAQKSAAGHASVVSRRGPSNALKARDTMSTDDQVSLEREEHERSSGGSTNQQSTIRRKKEEVPLASLTRPLDAKAKAPPEGFNAWWEAYPRRESEGRAVKAYASAKRNGATDAELLNGVRRFIWPSDQTFIPLPATWLNDRRWQDERAPAPTATSELRGGL